jgi:hypothetical protein
MAITFDRLDNLVKVVKNYQFMFDMLREQTDSITKSKYPAETKLNMLTEYIQTQTVLSQEILELQINELFKHKTTVKRLKEANLRERRRRGSEVLTIGEVKRSINKVEQDLDDSDVNDEAF